MPFSDVRSGMYIKGGKELMMTVFVGFLKTFIYLLIWPCQVLVGAHSIFVLHRGMGGL